MHLHYYDYSLWKKKYIKLQFILFDFFFKERLKVSHNIAVSHSSFIQCLSQRIFRCTCSSTQSKIFSSIIEYYMYLNNLVPVENQFYSNKKYMNNFFHPFLLQLTEKCNNTSELCWTPQTFLHQEGWGEAGWISRLCQICIWEVWQPKCWVYRKVLIRFL